MNPLFMIDFYKADHRRQYPKGTTEIYANLTPRKSRENYPDYVIFFGLQYFIKEFLIREFGIFFDMPRATVISEYQRLMKHTINLEDVKHMEQLHDLGYLPIEIKALPEGTRVPTGVPVLTIRNTHPDFFWLPNYLETILSAYLWKPITSATQAFQYKLLLTKYANQSVGTSEFVKFQAHDFSFRGMSGPQDAMMSGAGHLTSFVGTDTVPAIAFVERYYHANIEKELIGCSVPATEHSVMCAGGAAEGELQTFRRLITEIYPSGIVSIVSDTWDFWKVITQYSADLKEEILRRDGKVVFRPDSGDPVKILCGEPDAPPDSPAYKGAVQCLWDEFGGTFSGSFRILDSHVGLIYGDSITLQRAEEILMKLKHKGFASTNVVFGVGSFTYEYVTRDTFGFAMKATSAVVNGQRYEIFKDPITDNGLKKSHKGLLRVRQKENRVYVEDQVTVEQEKTGLLQTVYKDGELVKEISFSQIRRVVDSYV